MKRGRRPARRESNVENEERKRRRRRDLKAAGKCCAGALRLLTLWFTLAGLEDGAFLHVCSCVFLCVHVCVSNIMKVRKRGEKHICWFICIFCLHAEMANELCCRAALSTDTFLVWLWFRLSQGLNSMFF